MHDEKKAGEQTRGFPLHELCTRRTDDDPFENLLSILIQIVIQESFSPSFPCFTFCIAERRTR